MYKSTGQLEYKGRRAVLNIDPEIARFYRSFIPKSIKNQKPMYPAHITIVRTGIEVLSDMSLWGHRHGETLEFSYDPNICIGYKYIWLDAHSSELEGVRAFLGLEKQRMPHPLGKEHPCFHITIANMKF
jgi:hypothetical protein